MIFNFAADDLVVRQADKSDQGELKKLLDRKSYIHRHLGWHSPLHWLGTQPFYLLESPERGTLAALACPPDEEDLIWLRLFAVAPGYSLTNAWHRLWPKARDWLEEHHPGAEVNSLAVDTRMERTLIGSGFKEISQVVALVWEPAIARWPTVREDLELRVLNGNDLVRVHQIDRDSFHPLWRNTLSELQAALGDSFYSTVVILKGEVAGYQISTLNPQGAHLARLAVDSRFHKQGLGVKLVDDLLERCTADGIVTVSVNTQRDNHSSLALYNKFGFSRLEEIYPVQRWEMGE